MLLKLVPQIKGNVLDTTFMVHEIFNNINKFSVADLARSAQSYLGKGLAELAVTQAEKLKVKDVGFSGGVACNEHYNSNHAKNSRKRWFQVSCPH